MKKIENYGINIISTKSKETSQILQDVQYKINEVIFFFKQSFATPGIIDFLIKYFYDSSIELDKLDIGTGRVLIKKEEMIEILDSYIFSLKSASGEKYSEDELKECEIKMMKYLVAQYVKQKNKLTPDIAIVLLKRNKLLSDTLLTEHTKSFSAMQTELLDYIYECFNINRNNTLKTK